MPYQAHFRSLAVITVFTLLVSLALFIPNVSANGGDDDVDVPPKPNLTYPNLGSALNQLVSNVQEGRMSASEAAGGAAISRGGSVAVTIELSGHVNEVVTYLEDNGGDPRNVGEDYIEAYVPMFLLGSLSQQPGVLRVREIIPPQPTQLSQRVIGDGPALHGSQAWNSAGYSGQGVKVGVIDLSFRGINTLLGTELPASIVARCYEDVGVFTNNLNDCEPSGEAPNPSPGCPPATPSPGGHGTIVAESMLDMAPEVTLYVADPVSRGDLQSTVRWMASNGVQVINYSVGYTFDGPGDGTSPDSVSPLNTVDRAVENDILWVNSAGNDALGTWFGDYSDSDGDMYIEFGGSNVEVINMPIYECVRHIVQLRWEDSWTAAQTDLDLHLYNKVTDEIIFSSEDPQSGEAGHEPWEAYAFTVPFRSNNYGIKVSHYSGEAPDWVQIVGWTVFPLDPHTLNGSITNPAESANPGLLAVGAAPWYNVNTIERFSSRGPTPDDRTKPEIVGADCGETAFRPYRANSNRGFCGTSQASPHVAGMAALVRQRFPDLTAEQVAAYLKDNAEPRGASPNNTWGYGLAKLPATAVGDCVHELAADGPTTGQWSPQCQSTAADRGFSQYYSFTLDESAPVAIELNSGVDPYLFLRAGDARSGDFLHENDDIEAGANLNSWITATLAAGTYTIEATTYHAGVTGEFTLTISGLGGGAGEGETTPYGCGFTLTADGSTTGAWAPGCQSSVPDRGYARYYTFTLAQQSNVTIDLESSVDPFLYLRSGHTRSGTVLHENDDVAPGTNTNSRISESLAPGTYTIEATTYAANQAGAFNLTVSGLSGDDGDETETQPGEPETTQCDASPLSSDGQTSGTWADDCESQVADRGYARYYSFVLEQESAVTITLESEVDTFLYLRSGDDRSGDALHENDDIASGGVNLNSRISETLPVGTYTIEATTYAADQAGTFTLTIRGLGGDDGDGMETDACAAITIDANGATTGTWADDCQSQVSDRGYARYYTFVLALESTVTITLESEVDTFLYLREGEARSGTPLHLNDDIEAGGVNLNSRISEALSTGTYTIEATTYAADQAGTFTLTISGLDDQQ